MRCRTTRAAADPPALAEPQRACGSFARRSTGDARAVGRTRRADPGAVPVESALSGIMRSEQRMWVRAARSRCRRAGAAAVDPETSAPSTTTPPVYVKRRGGWHHVGGYDAFSADVTSALRATAAGDRRRRVRPDRCGRPAVGKQRNDPGGIFYTATSGIWQTVVDGAGAGHPRPRRST